MSAPLVFADIAVLWHLRHAFKHTRDDVPVEIDGKDSGVSLSEYLEDLAERLAANLPVEELTTSRPAQTGERV